MDKKSEHTIIEHKKDAVQIIRSFYNLEKPGSMTESVSILKDWINQQSHFNKKDICRQFLETLIISCKGSIEESKAQIDKYCAMRTMIPSYFEKIDAKLDFIDMMSAYYLVTLPKQTEEFYRIVIIKVYPKKLNLSTALDFYSYGIIMIEYLKAHDYFNGFVVIIDYMDVDLTDIVPTLNPTSFAPALKVYMDGYGMRIKAFHFITPSKTIEIVVSIFKQFLSPKLGSRIQVHKSSESLTLPKNLLPCHYGGTEKPIAELRDQWRDILGSEEHIKYMKDMQEATIKEQTRDIKGLNANYDLGISGTFKKLVVD